MRVLGSVALAISLISSTAFAATDAGQLAAGKPAGVQQANLAVPGVVWIFGLAIVAGGIAAVAGSGSGNNISVTTTGTSP